MTQFQPDFSPRLKSINVSDEPYNHAGGQGGEFEFVRIQLTETLNPCGKADALICYINPAGPNEIESARRFKTHGDVSIGDIIEIVDPYGQNFGGVGEWFDVAFRKDINQYNPIGSKGLVRRAEVVDAEMSASDEKGDFRVVRLDPFLTQAAGTGVDFFNKDIKIEVNFKYFEDYLPKKYLIGDKFYAVYFHDSFAKKPTLLIAPDPDHPDFEELEPWELATETGRWELMPTSTEISFIGWVTTNIPAAATQTTTSKPGTTSGTNLRLQQLDDSDADPLNWAFEDCKDGNNAIIEIRTFNMCDVQIDSGQRVQGKWIKGYPFVDTVCCPPAP